MSVVRIRPRRQITIPGKIFDQLHLEAGDFLEAVAKDGKIVMIPKRLATKDEAIPLSEEEQKTLLRAKEKINRIRKDLIHSEGLNREEIAVAIKVGLIDSEQAWWWGEEWQEGEREAEREIREGKLQGPFDTLEEFKASLKSQK
jgi:AbrB family looped-hinge helix DNA binding protein